MFLEVLLFSLLAIGIGLAFTFLGYVMFRIIFPIWGFLIGLWMGGTAIAGLFGGDFLGTVLGIIGGVLLGIGFAIIAYYVYAFAVVLFGASLGFALGQGLILMLGIDQGFLSWTLGIITAVIFGIGFVALRLPRIVLVVATSFAGASAVIGGVFALFGQVPPSQIGMAMADVTIHTSWFWWIIWFVLGVIGIFAQTAMIDAAIFSEDYGYDTVASSDEDKKSSK